MHGYRLAVIWDLWAMGCLNLKSPSSGALFGMSGWVCESNLNLSRAVYHSAAVKEVESPRDGSIRH